MCESDEMWNLHERQHVECAPVCESDEMWNLRGAESGVATLGLD